MDTNRRTTMIDERPINESHQYAMAMLSHVVEEPINGDTDCYVIAAFDNGSAAENYANYMNDRYPDKDYAYRAVAVGTQFRNAAGNLIAKQAVTA
jgi:hypothetical protein